jgi:hypothetical protein
MCLTGTPNKELNKEGPTNTSILPFILQQVLKRNLRYKGSLNVTLEKQIDCKLIEFFFSKQASIRYNKSLAIEQSNLVATIFKV